MKWLGLDLGERAALVERVILEERVVLEEMVDWLEEGEVVVDCYWMKVEEEAVSVHLERVEQGEEAGSMSCCFEEAEEVVAEDLVMRS